MAYRIVKYTALVMACVITLGCTDGLERLPLDRPSDQNFYSNQTELLMALNACYRDMTAAGRGGRIHVALDNMTDVGFQREATADKAITNGNIDSENTFIATAWRDLYRGIAKCNNLLDNMHRAADAVDPELFSRIAAEARFIRSFNLLMLSQLWGDVPLLTHTLPEEEYLRLERNPRADVIQFILNELTEIAEILPQQYPNSDRGRITRGAALALLSRAALFDGRYRIAHEAAGKVIDERQYNLHESYRQLFTYSGEHSQEVILSYQYTRGVNHHNLTKNIATRMASPNGWCIFTPSQDLVDSYECIDGLTIDKSPLYSPSNPFTNRDPRLAQTVLLPRVGSETSTTTPGTLWQGYEYKSSKSLASEAYYSVNGSQVANQDVVNQYASFTGYVWLKYLDELDTPLPEHSELDFILIRYAEVLLNYAEAKIELGEIDQSVFDAINLIRARAYGVNLHDVDDYPAISGLAVPALRAVLRRERKVELALEGFRYDDIRRWQIADKAMGRVVYGRPERFDVLVNTDRPAFDTDGIPNYANMSSKLRYIETNRFEVNRHYLWPIPQREIDLNDNLRQNDGY